VEGGEAGGERRGGGGDGTYLGPVLFGRKGFEISGHISREILYHEYLLTPLCSHSVEDMGLRLMILCSAWGRYKKEGGAEGEEEKQKEEEEYIRTYDQR
jgi:hypothetical protein